MPRMACGADCRRLMPGYGSESGFNGMVKCHNGFHATMKAMDDGNAWNALLKPIRDDKSFFIGIWHRACMVHGARDGAGRPGRDGRK